MVGMQRMTLTRCKLEPLLLLIAGNGPLMRDAWALFTHTHMWATGLVGVKGNWVSISCLLSLYVPIQPHEPYLVAGWLSPREN